MSGPEGSKPALSEQVRARLKEGNLEHYASELHALGVVFESELVHIDEEEQRKIGMSKIERKRFSQVQAVVTAAVEVTEEALSKGKKEAPVAGQLAAAMALTQIAGSSVQHRDAAVAAGAVPQLVQMLQHGNDAEQQAAANALRGLCSDGDKGRAEHILKAGAVPLLVELLVKAPESTKEIAAAAINSLCCLGEQIVNAFVTGGAVPHLVKLLGKGPNGEAMSSLGNGAAVANGHRPHAVQTSSNTASTSDVHMKPPGSGCYPLMIPGQNGEMAGDGVSEDTSQAGGSKGDGVISFVGSGAVPMLVQLLSAGNDTAKEAAAGSIRDLLCESPEAVDEVVRSGAVSLLVGLLTTSSENGKCRAAGALCNLADCGNDHRNLIVDAGAVPCLMRALQERSEPVKVSAAGCLCNLAWDSPERGAILVSAGIIPLLIELLETGSDGSKQAAGGTICNLTYQSNEHRDMVIRAGAVPLLVRLLREGSMSSKEEAVRALCNLARDSNANREVVIAAGALQHLVALLGETGSDVAKEEAMKALWTIGCGGPDCRNAVLQANAVPCLIGLLAPQHTDGANKAAAGALHVLVQDNEHDVAQLVAAGVLPLLTCMVTGMRSDDCKVAAVRLLHRLIGSASGDCMKQVVGGKVAPCLVELLDTDQDIAFAVCQAASNCLRTLFQQAADHGLPALTLHEAPRLVRIVWMGPDPRRNAAVLGLGHVASWGRSGHDAILQLDAMNAMVQMLGSCGPHADLEEPIAVLVQMARAADELRDAVVAAGGVPALLHVLTSGNERVQRAVREALEVLGADMNAAAHLPRANGDSDSWNQTSASGKGLPGKIPPSPCKASPSKAGLSSPNSSKKRNGFSHPSDVHSNTTSPLRASKRRINGEAKSPRKLAATKQQNGSCPDMAAISSVLAGFHKSIRVSNGSGDPPNGREAPLVEEKIPTPAQQTPSVAAVESPFGEGIKELVAVAAAAAVAATAGASAANSAGGASVPSGEVGTAMRWGGFKVGEQVVTEEYIAQLIGTLSAEVSGAAAEQWRNKHSALHLLHRLAVPPSPPEAAQVMVKLKLIPVLLKMLGRESTPDSVCVPIAGVLGGLVAFRDIIVAEGAIPRLAAMLNRADNKCKEAAIKVLQQLAHNRNEHRDAIVREGVVPALLRVLRSGLDSTKEAATSALWALAYDSEERTNVIVKEGAVPLLIGLLAEGGGRAKEAAAGALCNLACDSNPHRDAVAKAGAIPLLVQVLQDGTPKAKEEAVKTLSNLARDSDERRNSILSAGAVPALVGLLTGGNEGAKEAAAGALGSLACGSQLRRDTIVGAGVVPILQRLCSMGTNRIPETAAGALRQLGS